MLDVTCVWIMFLHLPFYVCFIMYILYLFSSSWYVIYKPSTCIGVAYLRSFYLQGDTIRKVCSALESPYPGLGIDKSLSLFTAAELFSRETVH